MGVKGLVFRFLMACCLGISLAGWARADIPPPDLKQPAKVRTYLYFEDINDIRLDSGTFDVTAQLVLKWADPRLAFDDPDGAPKVWLGARAARQIEQIWHPVLDISGEKGLSASSLQALKVYPDGTVVARIKFVTSPRFLGELSYFPFGRLNLDLTISSVGMDSRYVQFELGRLEPSDDLQKLDAVLHGNWFPLKAGWQTRQVQYPDVPGLEFSQISVNVEVEHDFLDGVHKILLPIGVIALASWGLLWVNFTVQPAFSSPRIAGIITLILTTIALKFVLNRELPVVHYLTLSDVLFNATILMLSIGMLVSCAIAALFTGGNVPRAVALNTMLRRVYPFIFLVVLVLSCLMFIE